MKTIHPSPHCFLQHRCNPGGLLHFLELDSGKRCAISLTKNTQIMTTLRLFRSSLVVSTLGLTFSCSFPAIAVEPIRSAVSEFQGVTATPSTPTPQRQTQPQRVRWTPNRRMGSARNTLSGGRRGQVMAICDYGKHSRPTSMTLLVPNIQDGLLTTAQNPSFFWHIETTQPISARFILSDPNTAEPVYTQSLKIQRSGISRIDLPAEVSLKTGTRYRWTVLLACKGGASGEVAARSFIERVSEPELQRSLLSRSSLDQAITFAAHGIWYDALSALVSASQQDPTNAQLKAELRSLLSQVGQRQVELARLVEAFNPS